MFCSRYLWIFLLFSLKTVHAQVSNVCIKGIAVEGNKKTKKKLVLNELSIAVGDSIALEDLMPLIKLNKKYLQNTLLFTRVGLKISQWEGNNVYLTIQLKESWYLFPLPQFELADRNFNVWWKRHNRDLRRANLGLWLFWRNISGYNDLIKLIAQFGYTRKFELDYTLPPMGRYRKFGFNINALYSDNKELAYTTEANKLLFYNNFSSQDRQFQRIRGRLRLYYRRTLFETQKLELSYLQLRISSTAHQLNPTFFNTGRLTQQSFNIRYTYTLDRRDIQAYPLQGYYIKGSIAKRGLGVFADLNQLELSTQVGLFKTLTPWLSMGTTVYAQFNFNRKKQPYFNNKALGYWDNYVRGYQYYVIDGQDYFCINSDLNFKILDVKIPLIRKTKISYLHAIPLKIHLRYHLDLGYVWDQYYQSLNSLSNTDLWGSGIGVDFIFYTYNIIFQMDFTWNKTGEVGLYLRYKFNF